MRVLLSFGKNGGRSAWLLAALLLGLGWLSPQVAQATHIRAGDIQSRVDSITGNPNHIYFKMTIYRDKKSGVPQDLRDTNIYFGDNSMINGADVINNKPVMTRVVDAARSTADTEIIYFYFDHVYPGTARYPVSFIGENRNAGIINMSNSVNTSFYISSTVYVAPGNGANHSPVLLAPAVDRAAVGQVWRHNPAAYDADKDSLAFHLVDCQRVIGGIASVTNNRPNNVPCENYTLPNNPALTPGQTPMQVPYSGIPAGDPSQKAIIVQDVRDGTITWNAPALAGIYNIAFTVDEFRRTPGGFFRPIGQVIRDMQIIVSATNNLPPTLTVPADLCVVANTNVTFNVSAVDGTAVGAQAPTNVTLTAFSGILPPATFKQNNTGTSVTGTFSWTPDCSRVSDQPYVVSFRAQDSPTNPDPLNPTNPILVDIRPVKITVVGPPPQNLRVVQAAGGSSLVDVLTWNPYTCQNASQMLIYRKENSSNFNPGPCETGIPPSAGYTQIGSVPITATSFSDNTGLVRGKTYCYRIYATFPLPSGGASIASAEACVTSSGRSAMLTNVDVNTTNATTGQITVKWTQPRVSPGTFISPTYTLSRSVVTGTTVGPLVQAAVITNLSDTTYVDRGLNTLDNQYVYTLVFSNTPTAGAPPVQETAPTASSVRTNLVPDGIGKSITVNWAYNVPWDNSKQPTRIYRQNPGTTGYTQIATVTPGLTSGTYVDKGLTAGQQYCYYVQTNGQYPNVLNSLNQPILTNLLNNSQQICTTLLDVPCTPVLTLQVTNCDSLANLPSYLPVNQTYQNRLRWTIGTLPTGCATNAVRYRIFRSDTDGGNYVLIDSTTTLTYLDRNQPRPTYCYRVQAVAANGQRSALSNSACQSDCVFFLLPNIFTPNGDGTNDVFRPKVSSPLLRTHIQIFNRWGRKVYEGTQDPYINWTGGGVTGESTTSGLASGGLYYYLAEVEFADAAATKRTYKGWVELIR